MKLAGFCGRLYFLEQPGIVESFLESVGETTDIAKCQIIIGDIDRQIDDVLTLGVKNRLERFAGIGEQGGLEKGRRNRCYQDVPGKRIFFSFHIRKGLQLELHCGDVAFVVAVDVDVNDIDHVSCLSVAYRSIHFTIIAHFA